MNLTKTRSPELREGREGNVIKLSKSPSLLTRSLLRSTNLSASRKEGIFSFLFSSSSLQLAVERKERRCDFG
jgi:hypothetical protein